MKQGKGRDMIEALRHSGTGERKIEILERAMNQSNSRRPSAHETYQRAVAAGLPEGTAKKALNYIRKGTVE